MWPPVTVILINLLLALAAKGHNLGDASDLLLDSCENGLNFDSLKDWEKFIDSFENLTSEQLSSHEQLKGCAKDREAILELKKILSKTEICDPEKVDSLVSYHKKYFKPPRFRIKSRVTITHRFFEKYAIQVAHICKKNLLKNLEIARDELKAISKSFEEARDKVYQDEPSIKSNIKIIESQPDDPASTNVKPRDQLEIGLNEYREALTKLSKPEDILVFEQEDCKSGRQRETIIAKDKVQTFFKPATMCQQLHRYYSGSILSIAKLANYGYIATDSELDVTIANNPEVRDWIIATQVCEPMLHIATKSINGDQAIIDNCSERVASIEPMVYDDKFEDLDIENLKEMVQISHATRKHAQKLMKSAYKKMAKADLIRQLKAGVSKRSIFTKGLSLLNPNASRSGLSDDPPTMKTRAGGFLIEVAAGSSKIFSGQNDLVSKPLSDEESFEILKKVINEGQTDSEEHLDKNESDGSVSFFDPMSSLASTAIIMAIMLSFEWLFFIVMTLAARICHHMYFNFENILTFPPKMLSWSDADFSKLNNHIENLDEDDFFDYDELTPDEQHQREMLAKVFGRPPPMLFKE